MNTKCTICPNQCNVDRTMTVGRCQARADFQIAKYGLHPYEEPPISYKNGSGTIFFYGCTLGCVFCQNYPLSHPLQAKQIALAKNKSQYVDALQQYSKNYSVQELITIMKQLEEEGAENINLVTASHYAPKLIKVFQQYKPKIPVVYNTHSYENLQILKELDRYIDIYLPDLKFFDSKLSLRYTGKEDYFEHATKVITFMAERKNTFENGKMLTGCIVRHLVLPLCTDDSLQIIQWFAQLKKRLQSNAYLSIMAQYTPYGEIENFTELQRPITKREYNKVLNYVEILGLTDIYLQEQSASNTNFIPNFTQKKRELF